MLAPTIMNNTTAVTLPVSSSTLRNVAQSSARRATAITSAISDPIVAAASIAVKMPV